MWLSRSHIQKFITIRSMPDILEGFFITMATLLDFFKILFAKNGLRPFKGLPARFRQDRSGNGRGVR